MLITSFVLLCTMTATSTQPLVGAPHAIRRRLFNLMRRLRVAAAAATRFILLRIFAGKCVRARTNRRYTKIAPLFADKVPWRALCTLCTAYGTVKYMRHNFRIYLKLVLVVQTARVLENKNMYQTPQRKTTTTTVLCQTAVAVAVLYTMRFVSLRAAAEPFAFVSSTPSIRSATSRTILPPRQCSMRSIQRRQRPRRRRRRRR